jgi:raffinose/stachyose/melibiose transport system permease protein
MKKRRITIGSLVYAFFALIGAFIFIYPIYFTLISSLKNNNEIWNTMFAPSSRFVWGNYRSAIMDIKILNSVANSLIFSLGATIVIVIVVTMGSFVVARKLLFAWKFLKIYYLIGLMIPAYGMLIPILQMFTKFGLRDRYLPMILLYAGINFPMSFFLITNYMDSIGREIDEAAAIDGCSVAGTVFKIIFPIAQPGIFTAAIVSFLAVYNELIFANTLLQIKTMQTISVALLGLRGERFTSWGPMFASIVLSIAPIMVVYILFQNKVESGIAAGAVKG